MLKSLNQLKKNETGMVRENYTSGELKQKLLDMGMV